MLKWPTINSGWKTNFSAQKSRWGESQQNSDQKNRAVGVCQNFWKLTVHRLGRPPTVINPTVGRDGRPSGRPQLCLREETLLRSTVPVVRNKQRALTLILDDRAVGRRAHMHSRARRSTDSVDRTLSDQFFRVCRKERKFWLEIFWLRVYKIGF